MELPHGVVAHFSLFKAAIERISHNQPYCTPGYSMQYTANATSESLSNMLLLQPRAHARGAAAAGCRAQQPNNMCYNVSCYIPCNLVCYR